MWCQDFLENLYAQFRANIFLATVEDERERQSGRPGAADSGKHAPQADRPAWAPGRGVPGPAGTDFAVVGLTTGGSIKVGV